MPMLVVTLKEGESVMIGDEIEMTVTDVRIEKVIVGVDAPKALRVYRLDDVKRLDATEATNDQR